MSRKAIIAAALILTVCFFVLGFICKSTADRQAGVSASTGAIINGEFVESSSGRIGGNQEKQEMFDTTGTCFYVLAGVTGVICIAAAVGNKRNRR